MLAANDRTRQLLDGLPGATIQEFADRKSAESIGRFCDRMNGLYAPAGLRVEYDGQVLRCIASRDHALNERAARFEAEIAKIDPMRKGQSAWMQSQMGGNVVWWYDLLSLQGRYREIKSKIVSLAAEERQRLENAPLVLGGDWEFNAWACPAGGHGDFIIVNWGFMHSYSYAAMFIETLKEAQQGADAGKTRGIMASSMIWMAAIALGYEAFQWDNLSLPWSESDRIWHRVQRPSERLASSLAMIEAFTMLHECGHIAKGHLETLRTWRPEGTLSAEEKADRYRQIRAFEFEADAFACRALRSLDRDGKALVEPLLILFSMMRLCEGRSSPALVSTHPTAAARFRACMEALDLDAEADCRLLKLYVEMVVNASRRRLEWQLMHQGVEPGSNLVRA